MIVKTLSGIRALDQTHGGVFAGRSLLITGRSGTGKSVSAFQFINQGLQQEEPCLILSTMAANDLSICAESLGFSFAVPVDEGSLILLEYQSFIPGRGVVDWGTLPSEGFEQLREIVHANAIKRMVLDTVLPWVSVPSPDRMAEHVFSFVRSCDRLGVTTLMTLPKPVSAMALRLKKALEDVVPICVLLSPTNSEHLFNWQIVKYLGERKMNEPSLYRIETGKGITPYEPAASTPATARSAPVPAPPPRRIPAAEQRPPKAAPPDAPPDHQPHRPARLSSVWKPASPPESDD